MVEAVAVMAVAVKALKIDCCPQEQFMVATVYLKLATAAEQVVVAVAHKLAMAAILEVATMADILELQAQASFLRVGLLKQLIRVLAASLDSSLAELQAELAVLTLVGTTEAMVPVATSESVTPLICQLISWVYKLEAVTELVVHIGALLLLCAMAEQVDHQMAEQAVAITKVPKQASQEHQAAMVILTLPINRVDKMPINKCNPVQKYQINKEPIGV
jgi:hypothetical protein